MKRTKKQTTARPEVGADNEKTNATDGLESVRTDSLIASREFAKIQPTIGNVNGKEGNGSYLKCPISYPGAKSKVVASLADALPTDWTEFREVFAGGASLSLYLMQKHPGRKFWINDLDPFVSCFWNILATQPDDLAKTLNHYLWEYPTDKDKICLCEWGKSLIHESQGVERAALYYVMSKTSYNGMAFIGTCAHPWRFNSRGIQSLLDVGNFLRTIDLRITNLDYSECIFENSSTVTYFDPPYLIATHLYGDKGKMHGNFNHARFATTVNEFKSRWMLTYNDDLLLRHYFRKKRISKFQIQYVIGTKRKATELLISNYDH